MIKLHQINFLNLSSNFSLTGTGIADRNAEADAAVARREHQKATGNAPK